MNLYQTITYMYPTFTEGNEFTILQVNGEDIINVWNSEEIKPTKTDLEKGWAKYKEKQLIIDEKAKVRNYIENDVMTVFTENEPDINLEESAQFATYFTIFKATGVAPDMAKYPLVQAQVGEWIGTGKLKQLT